MKNLFFYENNYSTMKMYIIVNKDLKMGKGKVAAQVGHAVSDMTEMMLNVFPQQWKNYKRNNTPKVVLAAPESIMILIKSRFSDICTCVHDAGLTQIPENSFTALAIKPFYSEDIPADLKKIIDDLKLL